MSGFRIRSLGLALLAGAIACGGRWDTRALERRYGALQEIPGHGLGDATPYPLPAQDVLLLFLCRWEGATPLRVSLPPDASPEELRVLGLALRAWEGAGLGVQFAEAEGHADIRMRWTTPDGTQTATTAADCAVTAERALVPGAERLDARLVSAEILLGRGRFDALGRPVALADEELLGAALHEIGHALGFQGHVRHGRTMMVRSVDEVRRSGRRVLRGEQFEDRALRAMYALPSGVVVARTPIADGAGHDFERLAAIAARRGWSGPTIRVGDRAARITWLRPNGEAYVMHLLGGPDALFDSRRFVLLPGPRAAVLLREPDR